VYHSFAHLPCWKDCRGAAITIPFYPVHIAPYPPFLSTSAFSSLCYCLRILCVGESRMPPPLARKPGYSFLFVPQNFLLKNPAGLWRVIPCRTWPSQSPWRTCALSLFLTRSTQSSLRFLFFLRVRLPSFFEGGALGGSCSDLEKTMPCRKSTLHKNPNIAYNQPVQQGTSIPLYVPFRSRLAYGRNRSNPMERRHPSCINMN